MRRKQERLRISPGEDVLRGRAATLEFGFDVAAQFFSGGGWVMKIERLIGILAVLLQTDKATAPYLAEKFEVSRRTIGRDVEALCKAGSMCKGSASH